MPNSSHDNAEGIHRSADDEGCSLRDPESDLRKGGGLEKYGKENRWDGGGGGGESSRLKTNPIIVLTYVPLGSLGAVISGLYKPGVDPPRFVSLSALEVTRGFARVTSRVSLRARVVVNGRSRHSRPSRCATCGRDNLNNKNDIDRYYAAKTCWCRGDGRALDTKGCLLHAASGG